MNDRAEKAEVFDRLAVVGKAFASAKRLQIIALLAQGERTVDALAHAATMGISTVSAHLQVLKLANLVRTRRDGTHVFYRLAGDDVAALYTALGSVARERSADVERALSAYLGVSSDNAIEEVSRETLVDRLDAGDALVLDVRPAEEYAAGHIRGAQSVPFGELPGRTPAFDPDVDIIAYCRGAFCVMASDAVRLLQAEGRRAQRLQDGILEWRLAGLPMEVGT